MASGNGIDYWTAAFNFDRLEPHVQVHIKKVYSCLSIGMLSAAAGAYLHLYTSFLRGGLLSILGSIALMVMLSVTKHEAKNVPKRLAMFAGFTFFSGLSTGPLIENVIQINPTIVPTAFLATTVIFICFSLSALLSRDRQWLYLGGFLMSGLSMLMLSSIMMIFFRNPLFFQIHLYLGLFIMCGFILYDTQLMIEKCRNRDDDYIWHCVDLFIDFLQVFKNIMIILADKDKRKKKD